MQMSDSSLSQRPLLVWPESLAPASEAFFNRVNTCNDIVVQKLDPERSSDLEKLAAALEVDFPHLSRSVSFYRSLLNESRDRKPFSRLEFIAAGPTAANRLVAWELADPPLPPRPRQLQVVFHH